MHTLSATLADAISVFLLNPIKPILMALTFVPWAWLISSKLEKDARYWHLNVEAWNATHMAAGVAALAALLFVPIFWIGWPVSILILLAPILVYWKVRDKDVPEGQEFTLSSDAFKQKLEQRQAAKAARDVVLQFIDSSGTPVAVPSKEDPAYQLQVRAEDLLHPALEARASAIEVSVNRDGAATAQTVDGIRYKREPLSTDDGVALVDFFKKAANLDLQDRRRRQRGEFRVSGPSGSHKLTAVTAGSSNGLSMRVDVDRVKQLSRPFDNLGLMTSQQEALNAFVPEDGRHGVILIGAAAGQGLRTSIYSFLGRHDAYTSNIKSFEREIELQLDGVDHVQYDASNRDAEYGTQLQSILRRDPDVVQTGFVQDAETARVITAPGMDGPLLYVPMRAASLADMIRQWVKLVGDNKDASKALRAVSYQKLVRTLCPNCKQGFQPSDAQLAKLNIPKEQAQQFFRPGGKVQIKNKIENCPVCRGTGYFGQTGIFEVLVLDRDMRKMLAQGDLKGTMAHARRNKMVYLQEAGLTKVAAGETSLEEIVRVTAPPKASGGSPPRTPQPAASASS